MKKKLVIESEIESCKECAYSATKATGSLVCTKFTETSYINYPDKAIPTWCPLETVKEDKIKPCKHAIWSYELASPRCSLVTDKNKICYAITHGCYDYEAQL